MVCGGVIKFVKDLNNEISNDGVSDDLSPYTLITGQPTPSYKYIQCLNFGDYVQAHIPDTIINTNKSRTTGVTALYPSGNTQGSWYVMSLDTGRRIHRYQWDVLPISKCVIDRVNILG